MQRLLVIYNPSSSNYKRVKAEVLDKLNVLNGYMIGKYDIKKTSFDANKREIASIINDGDIVLSVGGDATAAVSANAILESGKDATLSVLPYGNFNDLARTLGMMKYSDVFKKRKAKVLYPLDIIINGVHWRYATCYVTIGMTAESVDIFNNPKVRKSLQKGHRSSWRSYLSLAKWYFKNRRKKIFLPEFTVNGKKVKKNTSDYIAVNGRSVCRVMKGREDYLRPRAFRSGAYRLTSFPRLFCLMSRAILFRIPNDKTINDRLEFSTPTTIEVQAEGENRVFKGVRTIEIKKSSKKYIKVTKK